jgi:hypothetical protein
MRLCSLDVGERAVEGLGRWVYKGEVKSAWHQG